MPTPVGHVLGGLAVHLLGAGAPRTRSDWAFAATSIGVALLPDLDFALRPFTGRNYHHYFTHSLGFAALFALVVYLIARRLRRLRPLRDTTLLTGVYLSHIFLDLFAKDTSPPFGVQLLWPFSQAFAISPVTLFNDVWRGNLAVLLGLHNWLAVAQEVLILGPIVGLLWWWSTSSSARAREGVEQPFTFGNRRIPSRSSDPDTLRPPSS